NSGFRLFQHPDDLLFTKTAPSHGASPLAVLYPEKLSFRWTNFRGAGHAALLIIVIFFLSLLINRLAKFIRILFGKLFIAFKQYRELGEQPAIPGTVPNLAKAGRLLWATVYCILMVLVLALAFGISVLTLAYVLHLIQ
ncbi:MAG TPA: hypothetical protein VFO34_01475, partial [Candidatus Acidoferrales bacterium]|nr:hypothetical protein [Candidatus Acidoferrales bacterium]